MTLSTYRRQLLTGVVSAGVVSLAGCTGGSNGGNGESQTDQQEPTVKRNGEQYFFRDTTDTMGQVGAESAPSEAEDWQIVRNELSEDQWQEKQLNDVENARRLTENVPGSNHTGLDMTVEEMLERAEEIYKNQQFNTFNGIPDIENEDDEITFTRSLIKASQEAGVNSSGLADDIVSNLAEHAEQELDFVDFENFKLSTLPATESLNIGRAEGGNKGAPRDGFQNSGFGHMAALLQYEKDGETEVKYTEQTAATFASKFRRSIRDPEESKYRSSLDQDTMKDGGFPEHYVTAVDYTKARELEKRNEDILGFGPNKGPTDNHYESLGDQIGQFLVELVDDYYNTCLVLPPNDDSLRRSYCNIPSD